MTLSSSQFTSILYNTLIEISPSGLLLFFSGLSQVWQLPYIYTFYEQHKTTNTNGNALYCMAVFKKLFTVYDHRDLCDTFQRSAILGNKNAYFSLAVLHKKTPEEEVYLKKAADLGSQEGIFAYAKFCMKKRRFLEAFTYFSLLNYDTPFYWSSRRPLAKCRVILRCSSK
jgi:hypothetical protein